jgi:hypothetical protein
VSYFTRSDNNDPQGQTGKKMKTATAKTVKILGQVVRVGSNNHKKLVAQVKHFNDLAIGEQELREICAIDRADHAR